MYSFSTAAEINPHIHLSLTQDRFIKLIVPPRLLWVQIKVAAGLRSFLETPWEKSAPLAHSGYWHKTVFVVGGLRFHFLAKCQLRASLLFQRSPVCLGCDPLALSKTSPISGQNPAHCLNLQSSMWSHLEMLILGVPIMAHRKQIWLVSMRMQVQSLVSLSELRIWRCYELWCGSQTWLESGVAVALAYVGSCSYE